MGPIRSVIPDVPADRAPFVADLRMIMEPCSVRNVDVCEKVVLVRCELNVPLTEDLQVADDTRIAASLPTIRYLLKEGARVVILSHRGRPWGKREASESLQPVAHALSELLGQEVHFCNDCVGLERDDAIATLRSGEVLLLENVRYYEQENANDAAFSESLAGDVDIYVNDAFGNSHRPHASMVGVPRFVPQVAMGLLVEEELRHLREFTDAPEQPLVLVVGGAKVAGKDGKIHVIRNLFGKASSILVGGRIALYFLAAKGLMPSGALADREGVDGRSVSLSEEVDHARRAIDEAAEAGVALVLPSDLVVAESVDYAGEVVRVGSVPPGYMALDIGPDTVNDFGRILREAKTIIWNGPMGAFEHEHFARGTFGIAKHIASSPGRSLVGGGDSQEALRQSGLEQSITRISTGGGAMLTYLMGRSLCAIEAITSHTGT